MKIKYAIWVSRSFGIVVEADGDKIASGYKITEQTVKVAGDGKLILGDQFSIVPDDAVIEVIDD